MIGRSRAHNLAARLERACERGGWGGREAYVAGGRTLTHAEVHTRAAEMAGLLRAEGALPGTHVLLALDDSPELVVALLGAIRAGARAVLVNPQLPPREHAAIAADVAPALVLCEEGAAEGFAGRRLLHPPPASAPLGGEPLPPAPVRSSAIAYEQLTSGTTGRPKRVGRAHRDPFVFQRAFGGPHLRLRPGETTLSVSKMHFAYGLGNSVFYPLLAGARAVLIHGRPTPAGVLELIGSQRVDVLFAVPSFFARLVREPAAGVLGHLRLAVSAGERLPVEVARSLGELVGSPPLDSLGSTEVGQAFVAGPAGEGPEGTIGRALRPYRVRVVDERGHRLPAGTPGLLQVRGPTTPRCFPGRPEALAEAYDGRWLRTGDRAQIDERGIVRILGRADDIEIVSGMNIDPVAVEATLAGDPRVREVAVCAAVDPEGVASLRAYVVAGEDDDESLERDLIARARAAHPGYMVPRAVVRVQSLPRTPTGKLRRGELRALAARELASASAAPVGSGAHSELGVDAQRP